MRRIYNNRLFSLQVGIQACLNCSCNQILGKPQEQATLTELSLTKLTTTTCIAHTHINTTAHTHTHTRMGLRMRISYYRIASLRFVRKLIRLAKGCGRCHRTPFCFSSECNRLNVWPTSCPTTNSCQSGRCHVLCCAVSFDGMIKVSPHPLANYKYPHSG